MWLIFFFGIFFWIFLLSISYGVYKLVCWSSVLYFFEVVYKIIPRIYTKSWFFNFYSLFLQDTQTIIYIWKHFQHYIQLWKKIFQTILKNVHSNSTSSLKFTIMSSHNFYGTLIKLIISTQADFWSACISCFLHTPNFSFLNHFYEIQKI